MSSSSERLTELATPRRPSLYFLPDKPSVYWLDKIVDPTPHLIRNPQELLEYYETRWFKKYPRIEDLSQSKPWPDYGEPRPSTQYGIPISALNYVPSERIKTLCLPSQRESLTAIYWREKLLPPIDIRSKRSKSETKDGWDWTKLPKTSIQKALQTAKSQASVDAMSKGDFPARSRVRKTGPNARPSTGAEIGSGTTGPRQHTNVRLPSPQQGQGEIREDDQVKSSSA